MNDYVTTGDGTITLLDNETGELYHNRAGAYTEALLNYVEPSRAVERLTKEHQLHLLDICFGLGYNTFAFLEKALEQGAHGLIKVIAIECDEKVIATTRDVLHSDKFVRLRNFFNCDNFATRFHQISATFGGLQISLDLRRGDVRSLLPALDFDCDYVYHDPFSPRKVPELWTLQVFENYRRLLDRRRGMMLTYSSAGAVRGGLQRAGFHVYRTAAVGEKQGGTLASVDNLVTGELIEYLSDDELLKLAGKSGIPYRDEGLRQTRDEILRAREADQGNS